MKTKAEIISALKLEYPTIRRGSDETGYTEFTPEEYEATIEQWADLEIAKAQAEADEIAAKAEAEAKRQVLLNRLGITADEARLLLG